MATCQQGREDNNDGPLLSKAQSGRGSTTSTTRSGGRNARSDKKLINGQWHKICNGPAHDQPTYLPATDKYFYRYGSGPRKGRFIAQCRLCKAWGNAKEIGSLDDHGWVPIDKAAPFFQEAMNRIGAKELGNRTGISYNTITRITRHRQKVVRRSTLKKVILELVSIRRKGEYSINKQAAANLVRRANGTMDVCVGCGTTLGNYTEGCKSCQSRRLKRADRGLTAGDARVT